MDRYVCKNCNYRFERDNVYECPYCGNEAIEKEKNAEELLEEVSRLLEN